MYEWSFDVSPFLNLSVSKKYTDALSHENVSAFTVPVSAASATIPFDMLPVILFDDNVRLSRNPVPTITVAIINDAHFKVKFFNFFIK